MTICIVTSKHVSYNPRVVKEADALTASGHDVTVVTVCNNQEQARLDTVVMASRKWRLTTVAYRREGIIESLRWLRFGLRQRFHARLLNRITHRFGVAERTQGREYPELRRLACSVKADLYIAHHVEALGAACAAARMHRARFAFDAEDYHSGMFTAPNGPIPAEDLAETVRMLLAETEALPKSREQQRIEYVENKYLPLCDYLTAASDGIAEAYAQKYNLSRPITILNVFPLEKLKDRFQILDFKFQESTQTSPQSPDPSPVSQQSLKSKILNLKPAKLYWYSQVIGPGRGLEDAVKALELVQNPCELHLRGTSFQPFVAELNDLATQLGVRNRLFIHPPCPPDDLIREAAQYDIGLALETGKELNNLLAASNKMFTYMNAGLAIVATDTPGQRGIIAQTPDVGLLCRMNDAESLAEAINSLASDPTRLHETRKASRLAAENRFNWEIELQTLVSLAETGRLGHHNR